MLKRFFLAGLVCLLVVPTMANLISSHVKIIKTYSQNDEFYLVSMPFDNELPSTRGKTSVYRNGVPDPIYVFNIGFDDGGNYLSLSNDGEAILYVNPYNNSDDVSQDGVSIYKRGKISKKYSEAEITGCDYDKERCSLIYSNFDQVVDKEKSKVGTDEFKKVLKEDVAEKERFLSDFPIFSSDDVVYLTDSKKKVHSFDLKKGTYISADLFDQIFEKIRNKGRFNRVEYKLFKSPAFLDFPELADGRKTLEAAAEAIGLKPVEISDTEYKPYRIEVFCNIFRDGELEIEDIKSYDGLPTEILREFISNNKFDPKLIPEFADRWYFHKFLLFRNENDKIARHELKADIKAAQSRLKLNLKLEKIDGIYIPKDLGECFVELDRILKEIEKKEMRDLPKKEDMIQYHFGIGMWMRNNWGLWIGSRLQTYFYRRGIHHPDSMSSVVLDYYYDWLNGNKDVWKFWDKNPKSRPEFMKK
jgi:hypothetical protein